MQPVLGIANPPLTQRPLLQRTPQPLAANPPEGQCPALYPSLHAEGHSGSSGGRVPRKSHGVPFLPLQETGLGMPFSLSPTPAPVPTLLALARAAVSLERGRGVISAHPSCLVRPQGHMRKSTVFVPVTPTSHPLLPSTHTQAHS